MGYHLGVDIGTTYTAAATVSAGGQPTMLGLGNRALQIPSVLYFHPDGTVLVGEAAELRSSSDPARTVREFKRRMGDPVPILVAGRPFSAQTLGGRLLRWVVNKSTELMDERPLDITLTHPANWTAFKIDLLRQVAMLADVDSVRVCTEPEAAALQYASRTKVNVGDRITVYDLGGGTFDVCVLEKTATGFRIPGRPEGIEHLGGIDFDQAVFQRAISHLPSEVVQSAMHDPAQMAALARLRRDCVEAKEALSNDVDAAIPVSLAGAQMSIRLTRGEFEDIIKPALDDTVAATRRALRSADTDPADLTAMVLVGGSSRIPLVAELLGNAFRCPIAIDTQPKNDVAMGAARAAMLAGAGVVLSAPSLWRGPRDTGTSAVVSTAEATGPFAMRDHTVTIPRHAAATGRADAAPTGHSVLVRGQSPPRGATGLYPDQAGPAGTTAPGLPPLPSESAAPPGAPPPRPSRWRPAVFLWVAAAVVVIVGAAAVLIPRFLGNGQSPAETAAEWVKRADLPIALEGAAVASFDNQLWVAGGLRNDPARTKLLGVFIYDPASNSWTPGPSLPRPISHASLVPTSWGLYFLGGYVQEGGSADVLRLNEAKTAWIPDVPLPETRVAGTAAFDGARIIFAGGTRSDHTAGREVWSFDGTSWTTVGQLTHGRQKLAATSNGAGRVWIFGGHDQQTGVDYGDIDIVAEGRLETPDPAGAGIDPPIHSSAAVSVEDAGHCLVGGQTPTGYNDWWCDQPGAAADLPILNPRRAGAGAAVIGNTVYLVGGYGEGFDGTTRVESFTPVPQTQP